MLLMETMFICSLNDGDAEADDNMTDTAFERVGQHKQQSQVWAV